MFEHLKFISNSASESHNLAKSVAATTTASPLSILLTGELGTGKTTFVQGFLAGHGITEHVTSPTFALEQRYGDTLLHLDLYRLKEKEANALLHGNSDFVGIRLIEWPERASKEELHSERIIRITCSEQGPDKRTYAFDLLDMPLPTETELEEWRKEFHLQEHIQRHVEMVASVAEKLCDALLKKNVFVRKKATVMAAKLHDAMRFVDFKTAEGLSPIQAETREIFREKYGEHHEQGMCLFLREHGYSELGEIIRTHGAPWQQELTPITTEQIVLSYADKRVLNDKVVSLEERFADFTVRYGGGMQSEFSKAWHTQIQAIETKLFPEGPPL